MTGSAQRLRILSAHRASRRASSGLRLRWALIALAGACAPAAAAPGALEPSASAPATTSPIPPLASQLLTVVSEGWHSPRGWLRRYVRAGSGWRQVGAAVEVTLGHAGYGWGRGLHGDGPPPGVAGGAIKREGDGRSPAGVFTLGQLYGTSRAPPGRAYVRATRQTRCVDDPRSRYYNRVVDAAALAAPPDWRSSEAMLRSDGLYDLALFVHHNTRRTRPGAGSCIFLHVWEGPGVPTVGCTALAAPALRALAGWLEPDHAVLVALPREAYRSLAAAWRLPALGHARRR